MEDKNKLEEENKIFDDVEEKKEIEEDNGKIFQPFKSKDIVFLAIISAITLCTGAVMPLVAHVPVFGIIQIVLGLQFSLFPAIGLMKVRKVGSMLFISIFSGIVLVFMNPIMFLCLVICALISEGLSVLIFKGYKNDFACFLTSWLYLPLTLPFLYVWYQIIGGEDTVASYANSNPWLAVGMSFAVVLLCALGSFLGLIISKELRKAGALKK